MTKTTTKKKSVKKPATEKAAAKKSTTRKAEAAMEPVEVAEATPDTKTPTPKKPARAKEPRARDPRLPVPGTVLQRKNRKGDVIAECTALDDGAFEYKSVRFKSLSAAAKAAATDLKLSAVQNGFVFWQIVKPASRGTDPVESLKKAWARYESSVGVLTSADITAEQRLRAVEAIEWHAEVIAELRGKLQTAGV